MPMRRMVSKVAPNIFFVLFIVIRSLPWVVSCPSPQPLEHACDAIPVGDIAKMLDFRRGAPELLLVSRRVRVEMPFIPLVHKPFAAVIFTVHPTLYRPGAVEGGIGSCQHLELADIINFLPDATFVIDKEGKVISWNRAIEDMTGVSACR